VHRHAGAQLLRPEGLAVAVEGPQAGAHRPAGADGVAVQRAQQRGRVPGLDAHQRRLVATRPADRRERAPRAGRIALHDGQAAGQDAGRARLRAPSGPLQAAGQSAGRPGGARRRPFGLRVGAERGRVGQQGPGAAPLPAEGLRGGVGLLHRGIALTGSQRGARRQQARLGLLGGVAAADQRVHRAPGAPARLAGQAGRQQQLGPVDLQHRPPAARRIGLAIAGLGLVEPAQRRRHVAAAPGHEAEVVRAAGHEQGLAQLAGQDDGRLEVARGGVQLTPVGAQDRPVEAQAHLHQPVARPHQPRHGVAIRLQGLGVAAEPLQDQAALHGVAGRLGAFEQLRGAVGRSQRGA
jgi:hypothetical protein